ncbi:MAG TPA: acyl carrier protein [Pseudonocardiaceae bacterium]|jgi:act minimal PKS acyl carrier protein|nr:acyl carrier protein [Pseudonocardiaceae bacterium]
MPNFGLAELKELLASCAGIDEQFEAADNVLDTEFADLGYDSLALLEVAGRVSRDYGVPMPDDAHEYMATPRAAIEFINERFARAASAGAGTV